MPKLPSYEPKLGDVTQKFVSLKFNDGTKRVLAQISYTTNVQLAIGQPVQFILTGNIQLTKLEILQPAGVILYEFAADYNQRYTLRHLIWTRNNIAIAYAVDGEIQIVPPTTVPVVPGITQPPSVQPPITKQDNFITKYLMPAFTLGMAGSLLFSNDKYGRHRRKHR